MIHSDLTPTAGRLLAELAGRVRGLETRPTGTISVTDPDTGARTVLGQLDPADPGFDPATTGTPGLHRWVGNTTPCPQPAAPTVSSSAGAVYVSMTQLWASGGATPAYYDHMDVRVDGLVSGRLVQVGEIAVVSGLTPGDTVTVDLVAVDASPDALRSTPSDATSVVVSTPVDAAWAAGADQRILDAQKAADNAQADAATADQKGAAAQDAADAAQAAADALIASKGNLLLNGDPDGTLSHWGSWGAVRAIAGGDGNKEFNVILSDTSKHDLIWQFWGNGTDPNDGYRVDQNTAHTIRVSGMLWSNLNADRMFSFVLRAVKADGSGYLWPQQNFSAASGPYHQLTADLAVPAGVTQVSLICVIQAGSGTGSISWRHLKMVDITDAKIALDAANAAQAAATAAASSAATANGRNTVSTAIPQSSDGGGKPVGAVWTRIDGTGAQIGFWRWDGTAWVSMPLTPTVIPQIDIGAGTFGTLDGVRLKAASVTADRLIINGDGSGISGTLIEDGAITTPKLDVTQDMTAAFVTVGIATSDAHTVLDNNGLRGYNPSNVQTWGADNSTGIFSAIGAVLKSANGTDYAVADSVGFRIYKGSVERGRFDATGLNIYGSGGPASGATTAINSDTGKLTATGATLSSATVTGKVTAGTGATIQLDTATSSEASGLGLATGSGIVRLDPGVSGLSAGSMSFTGSKNSSTLQTYGAINLTPPGGTNGALQVRNDDRPDSGHGTFIQANVDMFTKAVTAGNLELNGGKTLQGVVDSVYIQPSPGSGGFVQLNGDNGTAPVTVLRTYGDCVQLYKSLRGRISGGALLIEMHGSGQLGYVLPNTDSTTNANNWAITVTPFGGSSNCTVEIDHRAWVSGGLGLWINWAGDASGINVVGVCYE